MSDRKFTFQGKELPPVESWSMHDGPVNQEESGTMTNCKDCAYWRRFNRVGFPNNEGSCHRRPPAVLIFMDRTGVTATWPTTHETDFCGDGETEEERMLRLQPIRIISE